jgi:hypothetical protein
MPRLSKRRPWMWGALGEFTVSFTLKLCRTVATRSLVNNCPTFFYKNKIDAFLISKPT